jgi:hypothetical protein
MGRVSMGDPITIKPQNNAFTVLAAAGCIITLLGIIALILRAKAMLDPDHGLFG